MLSRWAVGFCLAWLGGNLGLACSSDGPPASAGAGGTSPPTFTQIYDQILDATPAQSGSSCWGSNCHAPVPDPGVSIVDFSSKAKAYASIVPGFTDSIVGVLTDPLDFLRMPKNRPPLSADLVARFDAWVKAGALDN